MAETVILYSTGCPRCSVLKKKLEEKGINYTENNSVDEMLALGISVCKSRHAFISEQRCPVCGEPIADTYARVVGFYTPTSSYQRIRKNEFDKRRWMNVLANDGVMQ